VKSFFCWLLLICAAFWSGHYSGLTVLPRVTSIFSDIGFSPINRPAGIFFLSKE
jgi:hypothetical protein